MQQALRLGANEGGWRAVVVADAEWLNQEAQNSLLKLLEEPPDRTCLILASASTARLAATIRSRCQKLRFPDPGEPDLRGDDASPECRDLVKRWDGIRSLGLSDLLDWAEEYRGNRARAAEAVQELLDVGSAWLSEEIRELVNGGQAPSRRELDAYSALGRCRKDLVQRNANPQMVAERALFAVRSALPPR